MQYFQEIALDVFETNTYQYIEAKEGDSASRFLKITVTRNREPIKVDEDTSVSFRAIKADGTSVLNPAMINSDGTITAELTDQTLACPGEVIADISLSKEGSILSTLSFQIIVDKAPVGKQVTSTNEFLVLLEATRKAEDAAAAATKAANDANAAKDDIVASTEENANLAKSWAVGQTGKREGEDEDNSKYYAERAEKAREELRPYDPVIVTLTDINNPEAKYNYNINKPYYHYKGVIVDCHDNALWYKFTDSDLYRKFWIEDGKSWWEDLTMPRKLDDIRFPPHVCYDHTVEKPVTPCLTGAKAILWTTGNENEDFGIFTAEDHHTYIHWVSDDGKTLLGDNDDQSPIVEEFLRLHPDAIDWKAEDVRTEIHFPLPESAGTINDISASELMEIIKRSEGY